MNSLPYILVKSVKSVPSSSPRLHSKLSSSILNGILSALGPGEFLSLDFETKGDVGTELDTYTVGVALASKNRMDYIDFRSDPGAYRLIMHTLHEKQIPLIAHNLYFDSAWPLRDFGLWLNWKICTFAMLKHIANEGFFGQKWGLKDAMENLLGWTETNEELLDKWLIDNGYHANVAKTQKQNNYYYPNWIVGGKPEPRYVSPNKGEMYRAPLEILGHYACLDAWATHSLFYNVIKPAASNFHSFVDFMLDVYPDYFRILVTQKLRGMQLDADQLQVAADQLDREIIEGTEAIFTHSLTGSYLQERRAKELEGHLGKRPPQWKKRKGPATEPNKFTKAGTVSANWKRWDEYRHLPDEETFHYGIWLRELEALKTAPLMKIMSGDERRWLFYEAMKFPVTVWTDNEENPQPATDEDAMLGMGEVGKLFISVQDKVKVRQFIEQLREHKWTNNTLHPSFSVPGTLTGRLSGREPNIQQMPKSVEFLKIFTARPGYKLITCDVTSLENYVLAELSQDEALLGLYGPEARPGQDAYLYIASQLPVIGDKIRATGYNPHTATPEDTAKAKKLCKSERDIGKTLVLSGNYGAGPDKMYATLRLQGVEITLEQVKELHRGFWELRQGTKDYQAELLRQWNKNKGWTIDGLGHPVCVDQKYKKDIVNRVVQRTGHTLFVKLLVVCDELFRDNNIDAHPFIADLHDCMIYEVRNDHVPQAVQIMEVDSYKILNSWLGSSAPLKGDSKVCNTWGDDKSDTTPSIYTLKDGWYEKTK